MAFAEQRPPYLRLEDPPRPAGSALRARDSFAGGRGGPHLPVRSASDQGPPSRKTCVENVRDLLPPMSRRRVENVLPTSGPPSAHVEKARKTCVATREDAGRYRPLGARHYKQKLVDRKEFRPNQRWPQGKNASRRFAEKRPHKETFFISNFSFLVTGAERICAFLAGDCGRGYFWRTGSRTSAEVWPSAT